MFSKSDGYEELEWINNKRTACIVTDYYPNPYTTLTMDISMIGDFFSTGNFGGNGSVFGSANSGNPDYETFSINFGNSSHEGHEVYIWNCLAYGYGGVITKLGVTDMIHSRSKLELSPLSFSWADRSCSVYQKTGYLTNPLALMGHFKGGSFIGFSCYEAVVYGVTIKDHFDIVRDLRPARRLSDGEVGMYDTISKTFFTNQGTGKFLAGPTTGNYF